MAERILRSPGVTTRELDLSAPGRVRPQGIPAGIIGTAEKGPAFVPVNFATATDFLNLFGGTKGKHFGAMAVNEWMRNARSGLYLRVLGAGDGKERNASTKVTSRAGFFVGDKIRNQSNNALEQDGSAIGRTVNPYAGATVPGGLDLKAASAGKIRAGADEVSNLAVIAFSAITDYDGMYIIVNASASNDEGETVEEKRIIVLSSQAVGAGLTLRKITSKKLMDGPATLFDFNALAPNAADTVHLVDISGDTNANEIAAGIRGYSHDAHNGNVAIAKMALSGASNNVIFTNAHNGAVTDISIGKITGVSLTPSDRLTPTVTTPGVVRVIEAAAAQTLEFDRVPRNDAVLTVTDHAGTAIKVGYNAGGTRSAALTSAGVASDAYVVNTTTANTALLAAAHTAYILKDGNDSSAANTTFAATSPTGLVAGTKVAFTQDTAAVVLSETTSRTGFETAALSKMEVSELTPSAPGSRTMFLGCEMFASDEEVDYLGSARADVDKTQTGTNVLRGVIMFASGVMPGLAIEDSGSWQSVSHASSATGEYGSGMDAGSHTGYLKDGQFVMLMNGFSESASGNSAYITGSFDPTSPIYFGKVMNTDPTKLQEKGHYLYAHYDIPTGLATHQTTSGAKAFLGQGAYNPHAQGSSSLSTQFHTASNYRPSFENWQMKFEHAYTPWITSQTLGSSRKKLFRFWMLDAGSAGNGQVKISIANIQKSTDLSSNYGRFDVQIRAANDLDSAPVVLQSFAGVNLNPASDRYIARVIGDQNTFFDFERSEGKQKLVTDGLYENQSQYIRVEVMDAVENGSLEPSALPCGFQGKHHLVLAGDALANSIDLEEPPLPFRQTVSVGAGKTLVADSRFYWGTQYQDIRSASLRNKESGISSLVNNLTKWFPAVGTHAAWVGDNKGAVGVGTTTAAMLDANKYNNNEFSLEHLWVQCTDLDTSKAVDPTQWKEAVYIRDANSNGYRPYNSGTPSTGQAAATDYYQAQEIINSSAASGQTKSKSVTNGWRYLDVSKDFGQNASKKYLKFTVPMQGGWDGLDIFDADKALMNEASTFREMDSNTSADLGGPVGPTTAAFRKALDILAEKSDVDIQLLATPGLRSAGITDYAIDKTEDRFDALYIMDMPSYDHESYRVTQSSQEVSVLNSSQELVNRNLDTSFAATYFPDLVVRDGASNIVAPPSVAVLGALSLNDSVAHPWFAPAGFARGALQSTIETAVKLSRSNMDTLYDSDINPITSFPQSGESVVIFGQKTMLQAQSALDRVNVRRLLIDVRRKVRTVSNQILFEPNREATLNRFSSLVNPILGRIQQQQGLDRYKVIIDTTTTTQQDVENNTIRGKIFLQPTKSIEFISLDFVVTNAGAEI